MVEENPDDFVEDQMVEDAETQQEVYDDMGPAPKPKDDLYSLFWKVVKAKDSSKVGNVTKTELGLLDLTVRDCQRIALIGDALGHPDFGDFFADQGEITLATSASKEGWLAELFVSQKKFSAKRRDRPTEPVTTPSKKKKFNLFGRKK